MTTELEQARVCAVACLQDLRAALGKANSVEALVLLPLIASAADVAARIRALQSAVAEDERRAAPELQATQ